jgi:hypothetical protein
MPGARPARQITRTHTRTACAPGPDDMPRARPGPDDMPARPGPDDTPARPGPDERPPRAAAGAFAAGAAAVVSGSTCNTCILQAQTIRQCAPTSQTQIGQQVVDFGFALTRLPERAFAISADPNTRESYLSRFRNDFVRIAWRALCRRCRHVAV